MEREYIKTYWSLDRYEKAGFGNPQITPFQDLTAIHINAWRWVRLGEFLKPQYMIAVWPTLLVFIGAWIWQLVFYEGHNNWDMVKPIFYVFLLYSIYVSATLCVAVTYRLNHLRLSSRYGVEEVVDGRLIFNTKRGEVDAYKATVLSKCIGWTIGLLIPVALIIAYSLLENIYGS
jgi:hypothetical protein